MTVAYPYFGRLMRCLGLLSSGMLVTLFCGSAAASELTPRLTQYAHTAWRIDDGALSGSPLAITQTPDGYLWIGTDSGLLRFDGARFVPWTGPNGELQSKPTIYSLFVSRDGSLWIGTALNLYVLRGQTLKSFSIGPGYIANIRQAKDGTIWFAHSGSLIGPVCSVRDDRLQCYSKAQGMDKILGFSLAILGDETVCFTQEDDGVSCWNKGPVELHNAPTTVAAVGQGVDGSLLLANASPLGETYAPNSLWRYGREGWKALKTRPGGEAMPIARVFLEEEDGSLWLGNAKQGLYRLKDGVLERFTSSDGLTSDVVNSLFKDREGNLWVGTGEGLDRFHQRNVLSFTLREGLSGGNPSTVVVDDHQNIWVNNLGGPDVLRNGSFSRDAPVVNPLFSPSAMLWDKSHRLWVFAGRLFRRDAGSGRFVQIPDPPLNHMGPLRTLIQEPDGDIWALYSAITRYVLVRFSNGKWQPEWKFPADLRPRQIAVAKDGGIWVSFDNNLAKIKGSSMEMFPGMGRIKTYGIVADADGSVWEPSNNGLLHWNKGHWSTLSSRNGLPCDELYDMVRAGDSVWLSMKCGYARISNLELANWVMHPEAVLHPLALDSTDGARYKVAIFSPRTAVTADGKLWFATGRVLQMIDPSHLVFNSSPPPIHIEKIIADHKFFNVSSGLLLPKNPRDVEIDYSALSLTAPQKVRFRYRLLGLNDAWEDAGTRRQAFFTSLRPGNYTFQVVACNNDGVWNLQGDSVNFRVPPAFYQTGWFLVMVVIFIAALALLIFFIRLQIAAELIDSRLKERYAERDRIARELHDTLLQGFQGLILQLYGAVRSLPSSDRLRERVEAALDRAEDLVGEGRQTVQGLRSYQSGTRSLEEDFKQLVAALKLENPISCMIRIHGIVTPLDDDAHAEIYAIGREALTNAFRHSNAASIELDLTFAMSYVRFSLRDDGLGIPAEIVSGKHAGGHWGLVGMRERAAKLKATINIRRSEPHGTEVELTVPRSVAYERNNRISLLGLLRRTRPPEKVPSEEPLQS